MYKLINDNEMLNVLTGQTIIIVGYYYAYFSWNNGYHLANGDFVKKAELIK